MSAGQWDGRWDEQIKSEGNREVLRVSECKEGCMRQVRASVRQPTPEAKGPTANTTIKHASTASGSSGEAVIE